MNAVFSYQLKRPTCYDQFVVVIFRSASHHISTPGSDINSRIQHGHISFSLLSTCIVLGTETWAEPVEMLQLIARTSIWAVLAGLTRGSWPQQSVNRDCACTYVRMYKNMKIYVCRPKLFNLVWIRLRRVWPRLAAPLPDIKDELKARGIIWRGQSNCFGFLRVFASGLFQYIY